MIMRSVPVREPLVALTPNDIEISVRRADVSKLATVLKPAEPRDNPLREPRRRHCRPASTPQAAAERLRTRGYDAELLNEALTARGLDLTAIRLIDI
jgi:hypothetical protein